MKDNKLVASVMVLFVLVAGLMGFVYGHTTHTRVVSAPAASPSFKGFSNFDSLEASGNLVVDGTLATTTGTSTLAGTDIFPNNGSIPTVIATILANPSQQYSTLTLPASSTLSSFLPNAGQRTTIEIVNATTSATAKFFIAGGTGTNIVKATSTTQIFSGGTGVLNITRKANSDFVVDFDSNI